jgi:HEAT repeat protein
MKPFILFFPAFFLILPFSAQADSWRDPSWQEMIDSSDVIALVRYTSYGRFSAAAQVLRVYKGNLQPRASIHISGFSNRYGPIDHVFPGNQYLVFLSLIDSQVANNPEELTLYHLNKKPFIKAVRANKAFDITTATCGDLRVKAGQVQYDLLQTTYYKQQDYYSLPEFEVFLSNAIAKKSDHSFIQVLLNKIRDNPNSPEAAQAFYKLDLLNYPEFDPLFERAISSTRLNVRLGLARMLGKCKQNSGRNLLIKLLGDSNSLVQGEAVRQLMMQPADSLGAILLKHLPNAGQEGLYPASVMSPVMNYLPGGKAEIIRSLGVLKYQPAIPVLLPLLRTDNQTIYGITMHSLHQIGIKEHIPYLIQLLQEDKSPFIQDIYTTIVYSKHPESIPALMEFVSSHEKGNKKRMSYTVSRMWGLSHLKTDSVKSFLVEDFRKVIKMKGGEWMGEKEQWLQEYTNVFSDWKTTEVKPYYYDHLYSYFGLDSRFRDNPSLFITKKHLEDSLIQRIKSIPVSSKMKKVEALAYIETDSGCSSRLNDYKIRLAVRSSLSLTLRKKAFERKLSQRLLEAGVDTSKVIYLKKKKPYNYVDEEMPASYHESMEYLLKYLSNVPDHKDIAFMENLKKYSYVTESYQVQRLDERIVEARNQLEK